MKLCTGILIFFLSTQNVFTQTNPPDTSMLLPCPDIMCTMEFIPEECVELEVLTSNGVSCTGCPQWKSSCRDPVPTRGPVVSNPKPDPQPNKNTGMKLEPCQDIICTMELIPPECMELAELTIDGVTCTGCPQWKASCRGQPPTTPPPTTTSTTPKPEIACPMIRCEKIIEIPKECEDNSYYEFRGKNCTGCPKWRPGCKAPPAEKLTETKPETQWEISCPLLYCEAEIPRECEMAQQYTTKSGRICTKCPAWREGCREQERIATNGGLKPMSLTDIPCPYIACPDNRIPAECKEEQPYDFNGKICFNCPKWRTGCKSIPEANLLRPPTPEIACPLIQCDLPELPESCFEEQMYQFRDKMCRKCPRVKTECQRVVQPRPIAVVNPPPTPVTRDIACPLSVCPMIYIPDECREIETFEFQGKLCRGCPVFKPGCTPFGRIPRPTIPPTVPQIPQIPAQEVNGCPVYQCEWLRIPEECVEIPTVMVRGKNCTTCPRYREGCVPNGQGANQNTGNQRIIPVQTPVQPTNPIPAQDRPIMINEVTSCPMVACTRIFIPPECREVVTYDFRGRTCYKCPKWREGCIPGQKPSGNPDVIYPPTDTTPTPADNIACPLMACNRMFIPPECRELTPYLYMNIKTCYRCPKWRKGCIPGGKQIISDETRITNQDRNIAATTPKSIIDIVNNDVMKNVNSQTGSSSSSGLLSNLQGVVPVKQVVDMVRKINCPPLPCPATYIPQNCKQTTQYEYQGKLCDGCPTWRDGCTAVDGQSQNSNFDGLLSYNLFRDFAGFGFALKK